MRALRIGLLSLAVALATAVLGWWSVPVLGAVWGGIAGRTTRPALTASASAGIGWILLLLWTATQGPVWDLAQKIGGVMSLPGWMFAVITIGFPMLLAGLAAGVLTTRSWVLGPRCWGS